MKGRRGRLALLAIGVLVAVAVPAGILLAQGSDEPERAAAADRSAHPVAGDFQPDDTSLAECRGERDCLEQAFGNLAYRRGPEAALAVFDAKSKSDATVEANCHRIAHVIGSAALERYRGNVAQAFARGSESCWSGYYHGILEHAFADADSEAEVSATARRVCSARAIRRTLYLAYQCVHGLGHGLMLQSGYNLPFSLKVCDQLATAWDQTSCTGGVFMENVAGAQISGYGVKSPWVRKNDLVYPCNAVKARHKQYCYLMVTSRILQANGYDWRATARICANVERGWVRTCFESFGRDADGFTRQNARRVLELCRLAGRYESDCIYGAVRDMASNYAGGDRAAKLCDTAAAQFRARCYLGLGTILGGLSATSAGRRAACERLTRTYVRSCLRGAGEPV